MSQSLSLGKKILFASVLAVCACALLVGGTELVLRLSGYGHDTTFFRRETLPSSGAAAATIVRENRWVTAPYFSPELIRRPQAFRLAEKKPADTCRIFVLGSSAAMGDPEASFSLARMLEVMLRDAFPDKKFEVINAAITAVNSHVVREIAADCARLEPDFFIVYEGNNEVIGPYGPGTVFTPFLQSPTAIRLSIALRQTRTGQWLGSLARGTAPESQKEWGGMEMFLRNEITRQDPRLETTATHFRANLNAIVESARSAGAQTLLCTVLTNQRDFAPFLSKHRPDLSATDLARWEKAFTAGHAALLDQNLVAAERAYREALAIDDRHAELHFRLARLCIGSRRLIEAQRHFQLALDLDALRFRTDSRLNEIIRETADATSTSLVDLATTLAYESPGGILGDEFLYEHVHLNFQGTFRAAHEIFRQLCPRIPTHNPAAIRPTLTLADMRTRLGYTLHEQGLIAAELLNRFQKPPFTLQVDHARRVNEYKNKAGLIAERLQRPDTSAALAALYNEALRLSPGDWIIQRNFGMALLSQKNAADALMPLQAATAIIPDDPDTLFALTQAQAALGDAAAAKTSQSLLRELEPRYPGLSAVAH